jgi:hypothetical protein
MTHILREGRSVRSRFNVQGSIRGPSGPPKSATNPRYA